MKKASQILLALVAGLVLLASQASASAVFVNGTYNELFFNNFELLFDSDGNQIDLVTDYQRGILPGDYFMGIINVQNVDSGGLTHWYSSPTDQFTGVFVQKVTSIAYPDPFTGSTTYSHISMTNTDKLSFTLLDSTVIDLTGIINTGEMFALYRDSSTQFESNGSIADDIAKATDGDLLMTAGIALDTDYFYSHVGLYVPLVQFDGRAFGGLSIMRDNSGTYMWMPIDDIDENEIGTMAQLILTSELEQNRNHTQYATTDPRWSPWQLRSNDPATMFPVVPEPSTFILFGAGLVGLGVIARRRRQ